MISLNIGGIIVAAFIAGAFVASPEIRAYAANTVFSTDIVDGEVKAADLANNAVTASKIKDGEVKAAEIATDAVGAAELQGVTKLLYGQCKSDSSEGNQEIPPQSEMAVDCTITGVDDDDSAIASMNGGGNCFEIQQVVTQPNVIGIILNNECNSPSKLGVGVEFGIIVFDK
jgi:hypothetical protein